MNKRNNSPITITILSLFMIISMLLGGCAQSVGVDYTKQENWAYRPVGDAVTQN